jgi:hypothetical protein
MLLVKLANRPHRRSFIVEPTTVLIAPNDPILANFEKIPATARFATPSDNPTHHNVVSKELVSKESDADVVDQLAADCLKADFPDFDASQEESET